MEINQMHTRKNLRLANYDYSQPGYYFITICTINKNNLLGEIPIEKKHELLTNSKIILTEIGSTVEKYTNNINTVYNNVILDCYTIMPNHIHLILFLTKQVEISAASLPKIINSLKTLSSKKSGFTIWQRNYYEHVIRNESELKEIREYIENNPINWSLDRFYNNNESQ